MTEYYVHPNALCESTDVGADTRIGAFAHVMPGAKIGADCDIGNGVLIERGVVLGDRVTVKPGVQLWDGLVIEDDVFIGPNATFMNDRQSRSRMAAGPIERTVIRQGAAVGANATVLSGLEIGARARIGAGTVVVRSVPAGAVVVGNPARIIGYADGKPPLDGAPPVLPADGSVDLRVHGVKLYKLPFIKDMRGDLTVGEFGRTLPFTPKRYFLVLGVPNREIRGEHAHRACHQLLICVRGSCAITADDGVTRERIVLDRPDVGLYLPPMTWASSTCTRTTPSFWFSLRSTTIRTTTSGTTTSSSPLRRPRPLASSTKSRRSCGNG